MEALSLYLTREIINTSRSFCNMSAIPSDNVFRRFNANISKRVGCTSNLSADSANHFIFGNLDGISLIFRDRF